MTKLWSNIALFRDSLILIATKTSLSNSILYSPGSSYLEFLSLNSTPGVATTYIGHFDDGASESILIPDPGMPFGNSRQRHIFVSCSRHPLFNLLQCIRYNVHGDTREHIWCMHRHFRACTWPLLTDNQRQLLNSACTRVWSSNILLRNSTCSRVMNTLSHILWPFNCLGMWDRMACTACGWYNHSCTPRV